MDILKSYILQIRNSEELKIFEDWKNKVGRRKYKEVILTMMKNYK